MKLRIGRKIKFDSRYVGMALVLVILLCFGILEMSGIYGFLIFPDEFAYWAYAADAAGYDWSDITALGSYFSYGYICILFPMFVLCKDAIAAYRAAVSLNFIFLIIAYFLLTYTMRKMVSDEKIPVELFSALTILVPWNLFYAQMTMTEALLVSLYVAIGSLLFCYFDNNRLSTLILLMLTLMYTYMVHMRTVGILLSAIMILLMHILLRGMNKWHILVVIGMAVLLFAAASHIKDYALLHVYGGINPTLAADNDYRGQIENLRYICTKEGFCDLIITILGGILYLGLAAFGLFYWGMAAIIKYSAEMLKNIRNRVKVTAQEEFSLFILLSVAAQIIVSSIYLLRRGEVDDYTYGRYNELIVPFVMVMGFVVLWKARTRIALLVTGIFAVVHIPIILLVARQIEHTGSKQFLGYFMVGISYLYDGTGFETGRFYADVWLIGELLTLIVTALILFSRSRAGRQYIIAGIAVIELILAVHSDNLYLMSFKNAAFRDSRLAEKITAMDDDDRKLIYIDNGTQAYVGILQFMMREADIDVLERRDSVSDYDNDVEESDILIFAFDDQFISEWKEKYSHEDTYGHFTLLYND